MRSIIRLMLLLFLPGIIFSQKKPDTVYCDCVSARPISISNSINIGKTIAPPGPGMENEISSRKQKTRFAFEKEHYSAWYKLTINGNGHLCLNIIPNNKDDDYDFMLFRGSAKGFCDSLKKKKIAPVRACISRDKEAVGGKTGMSYLGTKDLVKEGLGDAYVEPLMVYKGEVYYLVLDNVYKGGGGHTIQIYFEEPVSIKGVITLENNRPIEAEIALTGPNGDTIQVTRSREDGTYMINAFMRPKTSYALNFYNDSTFTYTKNVFLHDTSQFRNIRTILPQLKKGAKHPIGTINFYGGSPNYLPGAVPSMNNLVKLMKKNSTLKILIEGHTNGCSAGVQLLSERRALKIKEYLNTKGINLGRINTVGKGCEEMLFPKAERASFEQQEANRRVEVRVLEY